MNECKSTLKKCSAVFWVLFTVLRSMQWRYMYEEPVPNQYPISTQSVPNQYPTNHLVPTQTSYQIIFFFHKNIIVAWQSTSFIESHNQVRANENRTIKSPLLNIFFLFSLSLSNSKLKTTNINHQYQTRHIFAYFLISEHFSFFPNWTRTAAKEQNESDTSIGPS